MTATITGQQIGYSVEFGDYFVSISDPNRDRYTTSQAYAECVTIAQAVDMADSADYRTVEAWAIATVKLHRAVYGDRFATAAETDYIVADVWAHIDSWIGDFNHAFGRGIVEYSIWPNHTSKTLSIDITVNADKIGRDGHEVFVRRNDCVERNV